jgi:uncharacterized membrane protein
MENVSSEEELLELRNEGKISEDEYKQLLETLQKPANLGVEQAIPDKPQPAQTSGLAIASLIFSLIGPIGSIPAVICGHLALRRIGRQTEMGGRGLAIAGLIVGYVVLGFCIVCSVPFVMYMLAYNQRAMSRTAKLMEKQRNLMEVQKQAQWGVVTVELKRFRLDNMEGIPSQSGLEIDRDISSDGNGSLRIEITQPKTVRLFETGDMDIENTRLVYQAKVRTENVQGKVFLEMWCCFSDKGEFFSKGLMQPLTGTVDWITLKTHFLLKEGENPDNIKLNLVIDGRGTVWIDDIKLLKVL